MKMVCPNCLVYCRKDWGNPMVQNTACAYCGETTLMFVPDDKADLKQIREKVRAEKLRFYIV
jgi:hypothetical protein